MHQKISYFLKRITKKYRLTEVFTPSTSAILTFVERPDLNSQINKALLMPGMQLIMYGHSGSGKTTIIQNILKKNQVNFISTNCILDTTINDIILDAFDKLNPYYVSQKTYKSSIKVSSELKSQYLAISSSINSEMLEESSEVKQRALPMQLSPQRLVEFLGSAGVIWIVEDFHKVRHDERQKFSQILKIFVDSANRYPNLKTIAIGAVGTAREVVNYDAELNNRISEVEVPLMTKPQLEEILVKGEKLLNINFTDKVHEDIVQFSNSLAAICHHLCFSICFNRNIKNTQYIRKVLDASSLSDAVKDYLQQNSDSFKEILDRALKNREGLFDNTKNILKAFCDVEKSELTQSQVLAYKNNKKVYDGNIKEYLKRLTTVDYGEILRYDANAEKYSFSNPFFKAYTAMYFIDEKEAPKRISRLDNIDEILKLLSMSFDVQSIEMDFIDRDQKRK